SENLLANNKELINSNNNLKAEQKELNEKSLSLEKIAKSLEDKKGFGILIDEDDNLESYVFLFYENKVCRMRFGDKPINPKEDPIKLKSKQSKSVLNKITSKVEKNASESVKEVKGTLVHIRLEWNNGKYIVYANNMKVVSFKAKQIYQPRFAFIVTPKNEIKVHSMTLKQTVKD
ncbi:MAG: hypothetical protein IKS82_02680, partial [Bacteroidales bacterium]|nr:hypothetical protein [Bacteroidales bacterium]